MLFWLKNISIIILLEEGFIFIFIFYGQADRKRFPPPLTVSFLLIFWVCFFILEYDSMCSETDFTQEKSHFQRTSRIPNSSLLFAAARSQNHGTAVYRRRFRHEKCIFEAPHNEIRCVLGIKESKFNGRNR